MQKKQAFRSEALRRTVASLPCVACGCYGRTQAAHSNLQEHGKGMGLKASDAAIMALCDACHAGLDQGGVMSKEDRRAFIFVCVARTYIMLMELGLLEVKK